MRKLLFVLILAAGVAGGVLYINRTMPPWYERIRYPLRYSEYVRVHARQHHLDPALLAVKDDSHFDILIKNPPRL